MTKVFSIPKTFLSLLFKHVYTLIKFGLIVYIAIKLGLVSKAIVPFLSTQINSIFDYFRTEEEEIIHLENLPFDITIQKPNKRQIKVPSWLGKAISIICFTTISEKEIKKIFKPLKSTRKNDQNEEKKDENLI